MNWKRKHTIAVLGSAKNYTREQIWFAFRIGREIGRAGRNLITGATSGIPYAAALGAHTEGALVLGISPAKDCREHLSVYKKPVNQADLLVFTGMGLDLRSPLILRSAQAAIFVGGELGTLSEFCSAWMCGHNVLGILAGAGGISDSIRDILTGIDTSWGSQMVFDSNPERLVRAICQTLDAAEPSDQACGDPDNDGSGEDVRRMLAEFGADGQDQ